MKTKITSTFIIIFIIWVFIEPMIFLGLGYLTGWITKVTVGNQCITALNSAFGTSFTKEMLPWLGAALGWIGSFFKSKPQVNNK